MSLKERWRKIALEVVFWGTLSLVFLSLGTLFVTERALKESLKTSSLASGWIVWEGYERGPGSQVVLPQNFLDRDKPFTEGYSILEKRIPSTLLRSFARPTLVLGRIGDSDRVHLNGCLIGSTGVSDDGKQRGWWWGALRAYDVPKACLSPSSDGEDVLRVEIYKWGGAYEGIYAGPLGVGEHSEISPLVFVVEWLRFNMLALFGALLLAAGIYYLFVFILAPARVYNGIFALCALSIGAWEIIVSALPYRFSGTGIWVVRLNLLTAVIAANALLWFLYLRLKTISRKLVLVSVSGGLFFLVWGLAGRTFNAVYQVYEFWYAFLLVTYVIAYIQFCHSWITRRGQRLWRYGFGWTLFMLAIFHDVAVAITNSDHPWFVPYGFVAFFAAVTLALAEEYADAFLHVEQQVDDRTKDLGSALKQLRAAEEVKSRFFANVSHDFKTPITVALGAVQDVASNFRDVVGEGLKPIDRSLRKLLDMVTNMLDTLKAESGTLKLQWKIVHVAELLKRWTDPFRLLCSQKGIEFQVETSGFENLKVPMDSSKMERVLDNLLSNAIKFADRRTGSDRKNQPAPVIKVAMRTDDARVYMEVSDSGIGIPEGERDKIFDRYYQSSRTSLKEHGGSGIGLSFAKEMVETHNGQIWVEESEFGGSKFIVALPLSQDVELVKASREDSIGESPSLHGSLDVAYPKERPDIIDEGKPTLLVAEDNPEVAQITYSALAADYNVHFAPNGMKAYERLEKEAFDGLVTDIMMPQMKGDELVEKLRKTSWGRSIPIIVLSSHGDEDTVVRLLQSGANDYVTKPFRREILLARVESQIHAHKMSDWLANNEKVIELGYLAGGMAHQIRNGLNQLQNQVTYQRGVASSLLGRLEPVESDEAKKLKAKLQMTSEIADRAMNRIESLTDSVRTYSSGSKMKTELSVADSIELAKTLHADAIKNKGISIEIISVEKLKFLGYSSFHEVLVNLIGNAIDACADDATGNILIKGRDLGEEFELSIRDNGVGISPEVLPSLCRPFFTTKSPTEGTGLGLYIVRSIVEGQHAGKLMIQSEGAGKGSTFILRVPKDAPEPLTDPEVSLHGIKVS